MNIFRKVVSTGVIWGMKKMMTNEVKRTIACEINRRVDIPKLNEVEEQKLIDTIIECLVIALKGSFT